MFKVVYKSSMCERSVVGVYDSRAEASAQCRNGTGHDGTMSVKEVSEEEGQKWLASDKRRREAAASKLAALRT